MQDVATNFFLRNSLNIYHEHLIFYLIFVTQMKRKLFCWWWNHQLFIWHL